MSWLFFALLPRALWAINNVVDKTLVSSRIRNSTVYLFITIVVSALVVVVVPFRGLAVPSLGMVSLALFTGILYTYGLWPYFKALILEEASRAVSLSNAVPIFVLIISSMTIGENFRVNDYWAFVLLLVGSFMISTKHHEGKFKVSPAVWLMLL